MYSEIVALNKLMMKLSESIIISSFENGNLHCFKKEMHSSQIFFIAFCSLQNENSKVFRQSM